MNGFPYLLPALEYQWLGAVEDLANLIVTGWDFPEHREAVRVKWGLTVEEERAAHIDACFEVDRGWGRAAA